MDKYYSSEQFRTILKKYEDMNKLGVSSYLDAEELTDVAEFYHMQGNIQQALEAVDMALRIFPGATTPIVFKARVALLIDNDIQKAYEMIEQIKDKSDIEYTYIKAETMLADYHAKEADSLLSERFNDFAGDKEDFILDAATLFADYDEYDLAEKWLSQSSLHEENDYKDVQARILMERGKYAESESLFNELIDRDPFSSVYWNRLASSQFMRNSIQESITSSEFSIAINPNDDEAILNKANGLFSLGNFEEALEYYKKFCLLQPANETGELFQGITLGNLDKPEEAIEHLEKALILARKTTNNIQQILQELAFHESRLGHVDKAMNYLDQNEKAGADENINNITRGYVFLENGNLEEAEKIFTKTLQESEYSLEMQFHIAVAAYDNGYIQTAFKMLGMIMLSADDDWKDGYAYYARCCYELGHENLFPDALKLAVLKNSAEARLVLADLYPEGTLPIDYPNIELKRHFNP